MSTNKTIIKNTLFLYVRMGITMIISLFTSRIVLEALGFIDYGIYAVVGGIVGIISFMQGSLSGATTRFLNFEMGKSHSKNLSKIFSSAFYIHLFLALIVFILGETLGLWYIYNKLNIPPNRLYSTVIIFHFSLLSTILMIMQTPYNATIIAYQKMGVFAYVSIIESFIKLGIAFCILYTNYDKLILYSVLLFLTSTVIQFFYVVYCSYKFKDCKLKLSYDKDYTKAIASFFGWDLYGNFSITARDQGIQFLQNKFFGPILNSSVGLATTIGGIISGFASNFSLASKPEIFKLYSEGNIDKMLNLTFLSARISFYLLSIVSVCLIVQTDFYLTLWLKKIPDYLVIFTQLSLVQVLINSVFNVLNYPIHATGKIKLLSFVNGTIILLNLPIIYLFLNKGFTPVVSYMVVMILSILNSVIKVLIVKYIIPQFSISLFFKEVILKNVLIFSVSFFIGICLIQFVPNSLFLSIVISFLIIISITFTIWLIGLNKVEKELIRNKFLK